MSEADKLCTVDWWVGGGGRSRTRDVNDNTSSLIIKLQNRIVLIAKRNKNIQKCKTVIESKI